MQWDLLDPVRAYASRQRAEKDNQDCHSTHIRQSRFAISCVGKSVSPFTLCFGFPDGVTPHITCFSSAPTISETAGRGWGAYTPCLLTSTAHVSGYSFIACSKLSLRSSSLHAEPTLANHPLSHSHSQIPINYSLCRVLNNRYRQCIKIPAIPSRTRLRYRLDLLNIRNREGAPAANKRAQHRRLRVRVDARSRTALRESRHEQRCAC